MPTDEEIIVYLVEKNVALCLSNGLLIHKEGKVGYKNYQIYM